MREGTSGPGVTAAELSETFRCSVYIVKTLERFRAAGVRRREQDGKGSVHVLFTTAVHTDWYLEMFSKYQLPTIGGEPLHSLLSHCLCLVSLAAEVRISSALLRRSRTDAFILTKQYRLTNEE